MARLTAGSGRRSTDQSISSGRRGRDKPRLQAPRPWWRCSPMRYLLRSLRPALVSAFVLTSAACGSPAAIRTTPPVDAPPPPQEWKLAWSDDFDGAAGMPVDGSKWVAETGGNGWGNQEREY